MTATMTSRTTNRLLRIVCAACCAVCSTGGAEPDWGSVVVADTGADGSTGGMGAHHPFRVTSVSSTAPVAQPSLDQQRRAAADQQHRDVEPEHQEGAQGLGDLADAARHAQVR